MNSRLFKGFVKHERLVPVKHTLQYSLYLYCLDLDELEQLDRTLLFFGYNKFRPASIYDADYLDTGQRIIKEKLFRFLQREGYDTDMISTVFLMTSARYFSYVFNPVSFYQCFSRNGELMCAVVEVNNTFGERHVYIPERIPGQPDAFPIRFRTNKVFHVSPFNDLSGEYEFIFSDIRREVKVRVNLHRDNELAFYAELWGEVVPLTPSNQMKMMFRNPVVPHLSIPRIYWQAAKLFFFKKLSYHPKPIPLSMMTVRRKPASRLQKLSMVFILRLLSRIITGELSIALPDGSRRVVGSVDSRPRADIWIHDFRFFSRVMLSGDIGIGESYMHNEWDSTDPAKVIELLFRNRAALADGNFLTSTCLRFHDRIRHLFRVNTPAGSRRNIQEHYDLSNVFFETFLDATMSYSCALYRSANDTLEAAQRNKQHAIIAKAGITEGDHVLEIGCGWGGFAVEAVKETGCRVTGITVSRAQHDYARALVRAEGLEERISILLCDYRSVTGQFNKIVSIEMLEAVGHRFLGTFFMTCDRLLEQGGRIVLQTITIPDRRYDQYRKGVDWIRKHIFPGGHLPSLTALCNAMTRHSSLSIEGIENIGSHYVRTLRQWRERFNEHMDAIADMGFDRTFQRKWLYYLASCEAGFAADSLGDLQIVLKRPN